MSRCPSCSREFAPLAFEESALRRCSGCSGYWVPAEFLKAFLRRCIDERTRSHSPLVLLEMPPRPAELDCAECTDTRMRTLRWRGVDLLCCPDCDQVFIRAEEFAALTRRVIESAEAYDRLMTRPSPDARSKDLGRLA